MTDDRTPIGLQPNNTVLDLALAGSAPATSEACRRGLGPELVTALRAQIAAGEERLDQARRIEPGVLIVPERLVAHLSAAEVTAFVAAGVHRLDDDGNPVFPWAPPTPPAVPLVADPALTFPATRQGIDLTEVPPFPWSDAAIIIARIVIVAALVLGAFAIGLLAGRNETRPTTPCVVLPRSDYANRTWYDADGTPYALALDRGDPPLCLNGAGS